MRSILHRRGRFLPDMGRTRSKIDELRLIAEENVLCTCETGKHVVIERVDIIFPRLLVEHGDQFCELLRVLRGQVRAFREIVGDVV